MAKIRSFGTIIKITTITIGGLTDINVTAGEVTNVETTTHDSSGGFREFVPGLKDGGTLDISGKYDYGNAGQAALKTHFGTLQTFAVAFIDGTNVTFSAIVGGFNTTAALDDAVEFSCSAKITGAVTWAAS